MNKAQLISAIAEKTGLTKKDTGAIVEAFTEVVAESLAAGEPVQLVGFGNFVVRERAERQGRNPQTGDTMVIPAQKAVGFKPGKALKDKVKG